MSYATERDLGLYLGSLDLIPTNAEYLLDLASEIVDELLIGTIYDVDEDDLPTDDDVAAALMRATCAQAVFMSKIGDETSANAQYSKVKIGEVETTRGSQVTGSNPVQTTYAPNALRALRVAGLKPFATTWGY